MLAGGALLARRNYRHGRGDREGALRLAGVMFVLEIGLWLCRSHFVAGFQTFGYLILAIAGALLWGGAMWMLYLAIEPWIRRNWPQAIISWSRLISGQLRDPVVGRDILFGVAFGTLWLVIFEVGNIPLARMGAAPPLSDSAYLLGGRQALGQWLVQIPYSIFGTLQFFFLLLGLKVLVEFLFRLVGLKAVRADWIAAVLFVAIFVGMRAAKHASRGGSPGHSSRLRHSGADRPALRPGAAGGRGFHRGHAGERALHRRLLGVVHEHDRAGTAQRGGAGGMGLLPLAGRGAVVGGGAGVSDRAAPGGGCAASRPVGTGLIDWCNRLGIACFQPGGVLMRILLAGILGLSSVVCLAQTQEPPPQQVQRSEVPPTPRHPQPAQDGGIREVLESIVIPPIPHAPFFATLATEAVKYAADGASMTFVNERHIARNADGRIYEERWYLVPKGSNVKSIHELDSDRRPQTAHAL